MIILCPTRGRPHQIRNLIGSASRTAARPPRFVFYVDQDDEVSQRTIREYPSAAYYCAPRGLNCMSNMWNACAAVAQTAGPGPYDFMFADDEAQFHTPSWDMRVRDALRRHRDGIALVQPNDLIHGGADAGYFFASTTWCEALGYFTPPYFSYGYADVWCMEVAAAVGRKIYLPDVVIENLAPKLQPPDQTHQDNQARAERDRPGDLYNQLQPEREADVARLKEWIARHAV